MRLRDLRFVWSGSWFGVDDDAGNQGVPLKKSRRNWAFGNPPTGSQRGCLWVDFRTINSSSKTLRAFWRAADAAEHQVDGRGRYFLTGLICCQGTQIFRIYIVHAGDLDVLRISHPFFKGVHQFRSGSRWAIRFPDAGIANKRSTKHFFNAPI